MAPTNSYLVYQQTRTAPEYKYKFIQLEPTLLEYIKSEDFGELVIKASKREPHHLVLCTSSSTWKIRQMNHSNNVFLVNDMSINKLNKTLEHITNVNSRDQKLLAIEKLSYEYELTKEPGHICTDHLPVYDGSLSPVKDATTKETVEMLKQDSPISNTEFFTEWYKLGGSEVDGVAVILSPDFITEVLLTLITLLISKRVDINLGATSLKLEEIAVLLDQENRKFSSSITNTVLHKFCASFTSSNTCKLDSKAIATWFGIQTLITTKSAPMTPKEFLIKWKSTLPEFYSVSIDLSYLRGHYFRPSPERIQYLDHSSLDSSNLSARVKELFKITREWDYDEFLPFVSSFIPMGKKPESIVMKYAKKKRVSKSKSLVCPR